EPPLVVLVQPRLVVVDEDGSGDVHRVHQAEALLDAAPRHLLGHAAGDVHEVHPRGHVHREMDGVRPHASPPPDSPAAFTDSNTRVAISRLTPSRTVPQATVTVAPPSRWSATSQRSRPSKGSGAGGSGRRAPGRAAVAMTLPFRRSRAPWTAGLAA